MERDELPQIVIDKLDRIDNASIGAVLAVANKYGGHSDFYINPVYKQVNGKETEIFPGFKMGDWYRALRIEAENRGIL